MPQVVGLDIGTSAVRASELEVGSTPPALKAYGQVGLPPGAIVDGEVQDVTAVAEAIARLWKNGQFTAHSVIVGIAGLRAITRELDLPFVPDSEVDSAVRFQSEEVIPFPPEQTLLSAQLLADYQAPDGQMMRRVLVAAAHRDLVDGVVEAVHRAGLDVEGVDLNSSAVVRALADPVLSSEQPEAIVSVGAGLTVVVVHEMGRPQFVRTIGVAGNAVTAAISSSLDLPMADAESIKRRLGEDVPQVQAAEQAAQATLSEIVSEVRNSIQYFASLPGRAPIGRVVVTGGGSRLRGFLEQLQGQVRIPVQAVSPLARLDLRGIDLTPDQAAAIDPVLATPIGLALPESNPAAQKFNLVPPEILERGFQRRVRRWTILAGVAALVLIAGWAVLAYFQQRSAQNDIASLNSNIATLNAEIPTYDSVVAVQQAVQSAQSQLKSIAGAAVDWSAVITSLQQQDPAGLALTNFTGTAGATASSSSSSSSSTTSSATPGLGEISVSVAGPAQSEVTQVGNWLDDVPRSPMFNVAASNIEGSVTFTAGQISFSSTISVSNSASVAQNGKRLSK